MNDAVAQTSQCANPDCRIAETGKCVEGYPKEDCAHFGHAPRTPEDAGAQSNQPVTVQSTAIRLPGADHLNVQGAERILRAADGRVVAIIGPADAGKTTLIASLYDMFQRGPVSDCGFSGSATLHAFERACHDARTTSNRNEPFTERTGVGGVAFYHLGLAGTSPRHRLALILADRAGEEYRSAADDVTVSATFMEIQRADAVTILVDGGRLLDRGARHNVRSETEMIIQALVDGDTVLHRPRVAVVLTKLDAVNRSEHHARAIADFNAIVESVRRLHGSTFKAVEAFTIAASPKSTELPRGYGLAQLMAFWVGSHETRVVEASSSIDTPARAFARFGDHQP